MWSFLACTSYHHPHLSKSHYHANFNLQVVWQPYNLVWVVYFSNGHDLFQSLGSFFSDMDSSFLALHECLLCLTYRLSYWNLTYHDFLPLYLTPPPGSVAAKLHPWPELSAHHPFYFPHLSRLMMMILVSTDHLWGTMFKPRCWLTPSPH